MEKRITARQLSALIFMSVMALKIFMVPGLLTKYAGRNGWISMTIFMVIELLEFFVILWVIKLHPNHSFVEILKDYFGKILTYVWIGFIIVILSVKLILMLGELKMFFTATPLKSVDFGPCFAILLFLLIVFSLKGLRPIGRMAQFFLPFVLGALVILFLLTVMNLNIDGLLPIEFDTEKVGNVLKMFPVWFGDVAVLLICCGKVRIRRKFILSGMATAIVSSLAVIYFAVIMFATYGDYSNIIDYGHNISNMVLYSSGSYLYGRFDIPIFCIWMISVFVQIILSFYAIASLLHEIFGVSELLWAIVTGVALFILCEFIISDKTALFELCTGWPRYLNLLVEVILPLSILIISAFKRRKNETDIQKENSDI